LEISVIGYQISGSEEENRAELVAEGLGGEVDCVKAAPRRRTPNSAEALRAGVIVAECAA